MDEQLPTPVTDIIILHIYLASVTLVVFVLALIYLLKINQKLGVVRFLINLAVYSLVAGFGSFMLWMFWPFPFDIMFGPFNLPTLMVSVIVIFLLVKMQKLRLWRKDAIS